ncbi:MAG: hypothetical protein ABSG34_12785 [Candidatus Sulfotelmatobacter sp.]
MLLSAQIWDEVGDWIVGGHLLDGPFGGMIGVVVVQIKATDTLLGVHHHHQAEREP